MRTKCLAMACLICFALALTGCPGVPGPTGEYTLSYTTDTNGSILGESTQTVEHGGGGTPVEAVPDTGYEFVQWSDGATANPRVDTNVTADITVEAQFAVLEPGAALEGTWLWESREVADGVEMVDRDVMSFQECEMIWDTHWYDRDVDTEELLWEYRDIWRARYVVDESTDPNQIDFYVYEMELSGYDDQETPPEWGPFVFTPEEYFDDDVDLVDHEGETSVEFLGVWRVHADELAIFFHLETRPTDLTDPDVLTYERLE